MGKKQSVSRYQRLVAGFAASAFALLGLLTAQQYEANTVTAEVLSQPASLINYRAHKACILKKNATEQQVRLCRRILNAR